MTDDNVKYTLAVSLLQKLCRLEHGENFVFSPLSLGTALAMLTAGLRGEGKTELLRLFGAVDDSELHAMFSALLSKKDLPLKIANKYLADKDFKIHQHFESLLQEKYESEIECVDFAKNAREIESDVNAWVARKTDDMIPKLLPEGTLNANVILVILNAIHFKGSWFQNFDLVPDLQNFTLRNGEKVQRNFITKKSDQFRYTETETLCLIMLPYKEAGFYMLVAIPRNENDHIDEVIADMEPAELVKVIKSAKYRQDVILSMPKFKIEYHFRSVQSCMKELGVEKIFVPCGADYGNLFTSVGRGPFVDPIIHKAVIEVDEEGTTAAAATAIIMRGRSLPPRSIKVELNRPFCFMIMSEDDLVCFAGICAQP